MGKADDVVAACLGQDVESSGFHLDAGCPDLDGGGDGSAGFAIGSFCGPGPGGDDWLGPDRAGRRGARARRAGSFDGGLHAAGWRAGTPTQRCSHYLSELAVARVWAVAKIVAAIETSVAVVPWPRESRTAPSATSGAHPIASSVAAGVSLPA